MGSLSFVLIYKWGKWIVCPKSYNFMNFVLPKTLPQGLTFINKACLPLKVFCTFQSSFPYVFSGIHLVLGVACPCAGVVGFAAVTPWSVVATSWPLTVSWCPNAPSNNSSSFNLYISPFFFNVKLFSEPWEDFIVNKNQIKTATMDTPFKLTLPVQ